MEHYLAIVMVALGTYLARYLPLRFRFRIGIEEYLEYSSAGLISALFVTSLASSKPVSASVLALIVVLLTFLRWRNLGLSILAGVAAHLVITLIQKGY